MKKILIKIKDNTLIFKERIKLKTEQKNLLNTNVISANELVFTDEYIAENPKIITSFIKELCESENIKQVIIENDSIYILITNILINNKLITSIYYKDDTPITYKLCELLAKSSIKNINCYSIQPFMLEYLDKFDKIVESRSEILFLSNFMQENNLNQFSSLFYKINLKIDFPMSEQDEEDFITFCKINKYLKNINVNIASLSDLEFIVDNLRKNNKKNIKILIHDNITEERLIEYLRNFNKKKSKRYKITFKLTYSDDYIAKNIVKQTNSKILKTCGLLIIGIITLSFVYVFYDNYSSMQNVNNIQNSIAHTIEITDATDIIEDLNLEKEDEEGNTKKVLNEDIVSLLLTNPETVGWLKLNETNIDYPVVQGTDNQFYLKHNFNLEPDNNGWVFMDHRNNHEVLDDNTIFYAHNRYYSGVMFGTLQNVLRSNWYKKEENLTISYRSIYENYEFQIFSVYKIFKTTDYMSTNFTTPEVKEQFFKMLKDRSIYDFGITPTGNDKIITLSTCVNGDNRIVVHAVLKNVTTS